MFGLAPHQSQTDLGTFLTFYIVITLIRIFVNSETKEAYTWAFIGLHKLLQTRFGIELRWKHIDINGKQVGIVSDQDPKQMAGMLLASQTGLGAFFY
jgi:hypothetical protein